MQKKHLCLILFNLLLQFYLQCLENYRERKLNCVLGSYSGLSLSFPTIKQRYFCKICHLVSFGFTNLLLKCSPYFNYNKDQIRVFAYSVENYYVLSKKHTILVSLQKPLGKRTRTLQLFASSQRKCPLKCLNPIIFL